MLYIALIVFLIIWFSLWFKLMENKEQDLLKKFDRIVIYLIFLFAVFCVFLIMNWFGLEFKPDKSSIEQEDKIRSAYGALGDYFGGILNPIFGFLGLFVLLWTLRVTREEMRETKKALHNQERELLLTRLSETFTRQSEGVNKHLEMLSVNFPSNSPVLSNRRTAGTDVIHDLSVILLDISNNSQNSNQYSVAVRDHVLMPNSRIINNYSNSLHSSLNMFMKTINLYGKELGEKEKKQLFIIIETILNYENSYYFMFILHEANKASHTTGMMFPYSRELSKAKSLMEELNIICRPNDVINSNASLVWPFEVQEWGQPRSQMPDL